MEDWDQEKLEKVVEQKGKEYKNANRPTDIVRYPMAAVSGFPGTSFQSRGQQKLQPAK